MVDDPEIALPEDFTISQMREQAEPAQLGELLGNYWQQYWMRDTVREQEQPDAWETFIAIADTTPRHPTIEVDLTDLTLWKAAITSLKSASSRGVCGFYPDELKLLAQCDTVLTDLAAIFATLRHFPPWMMAARVIPLAKMEGANQASQIRPITVLALLYRIWAKVTCRVILESWASSFPRAISGFLPKRHPEFLIYHLQFQLERVHLGLAEEQYGGLTLDLVKCFNQLARWPCFYAMQRLGVPHHLTKVWQQSLSSMRRWWHINGHLHRGPLATTGVPKGDTWSVLSMLSLNMIWQNAIQSDTMQINAYADNWAYATMSAADHARALRGTMAVTESLRLQVDWKKTWIWSTNVAHKDALHAAASQFLPADLRLQNVPNARELGYIMHYRRVQFRGTQKDRHHACLKRLKKLHYYQYDLDTTAQLAQQAVITKAFFGVHIYVPAQKYFDEIRSGISKALLPGKYTNPYLVCSLASPRVTDPELWVICQAIKAARRYLQYADEECQMKFLHLASRRPMLAQQITGPACALAHYLHRIGWQLTQDGQLLMDGHMQLPLLTCDFASIIEAARAAWGKHVAMMLTRKEWKQALPIELELTGKQMWQRSNADRQMLLREITGSFMFKQNQQKFDLQEDDLCELCNAPDSLEHRIYECPNLEDARTNHTWILQRLQELDRQVLHLPVLHQEPLDDFWRFMHYRTVKTEVQIYPEPVPRNKYYTDGSCYFPAIPKVRWAAFSVIQEIQTLVPSTANELLQQPADDPGHLHVVAVGLCPGKQSIPRAQLEAMLTVIANDPTAWVATDSQYVCDTFELISKTTNIKELHMKPNYDQLQRLWFLLRDADELPTITKVKAHKKLQTAMPASELRNVIGNNYADLVAKAAAKRLGGPIAKDKMDRAKELQNDIQLLKMHYDCRLDLCRLRTKMVENIDKAIQWSIGSSSVREEFIRWQPAPPTWTPEPVLDERCQQASSWGADFANLVLQWTRMLKWPKEAQTTSRSTPIGITWIELAVNFWLTTGRSIPVNTSPPGKPQRYQSEEKDVAFTRLNTNMLRMATSFRYCLQQLQRVCQQELLPWKAARNVRSLYALTGYGHAAGFGLRPVLPHQKDTILRVASWLNAPAPEPYPDLSELRPIIFVQSLPERLNPQAARKMYNFLLKEKRHR